MPGNYRIAFEQQASAHRERALQKLCRRPFSPLPFKWHEGEPISVLIVYEAQSAKNVETQLHQALRSLSHNTTFLPTGTPLHNRWADIFGPLSLLPGCPFRDRDHFQAMFTAPRSGQHHKCCLHPA